MEGRKVKSICTSCRGKGCDRCDWDGYIFVFAIPTTIVEEEPKFRKPAGYYNTAVKRKYLDKIIKAIRDFQKKYFDNNENPSYLIPMRLKDIRQVTGLNISTICRALQDEKINGVLIKELFGKEVNGHSNKVICKAIQMIIKGENQLRPFSDSQIQKRLLDIGHKLSRRTVTKYREHLGLENSKRRATLI